MMQMHGDEYCIELSEVHPVSPCVLESAIWLFAEQQPVSALNKPPDYGQQTALGA